MALDQTGVLIIRAWVEEGSTEPLRARLRVVNDLNQPVERTLAFTDADEVGAYVTAWLREMLEPC